MRFVVFMIPGRRKDYVAGAMPEQAAIDKMMKYNEELARAGVLMGAGGFYPNGQRVAFAGGKPTVTDGPFAETKELIGGYWLWQCKSVEEALEWARRCPADEGDVIEMRREYDSEDFDPKTAAKEKELIAILEERKKKE